MLRVRAGARARARVRDGESRPPHELSKVPMPVVAQKPREAVDSHCSTCGGPRAAGAGVAPATAANAKRVARCSIMRPVAVHETALKRLLQGGNVLVRWCGKARRRKSRRTSRRSR
jgi:hypothetical protein